MSRPVLITMSVLAGAQVAVGGAALGDVIGKDAAGIAILIVGAIQAGMQFYVQGQVTPNISVAAHRTPDGSLVAGPAAPGRTQTGDVVDVLPATPVET